ncbi:MAG: hypothetical protein WC389_20775 [Lutibacter sp.]|jgi:hypothetical protein
MYQLENNTTSFIIDSYYVAYETGLPKHNYDFSPVLGDGSIVSGIGSLPGRVIKLTRIFTRFQEEERNNFIEWFNQPLFKDIYLKWTTTNFTGRTKVIPYLGGGESFATRNFNFGKELTFEMFQPDPYFESTSQTSTNIILTSSTQSSGIVTISGERIFPAFSFTSTAAFSIFEVKTAEGYGFRVDYAFAAGDIIAVSTTDSAIKMTVNGGEVAGYFTSNSRPFNLFSSQNTLYVRAAAGTLTINYNQRKL